MGKKERILIVSSTCETCKKVLESLTEEEKKNMTILDVTESFRAASILRDLGIYKVPMFVVLYEKESDRKMCTIDLEKKEVKCVEPSPESLDEEVARRVAEKEKATEKAEEKR